MTSPIIHLSDSGEPVVSAPFFVRGEVVEGADIVQKSRDLGVTFATPSIPFDKAIPPRTEVRSGQLWMK